MAAKRSATTELNHDNWNEEHEPEEAGTFIRASDDILEKRVVKRAKRRLQSTENNTKSAFGAFTGFKTTGPSTPQNAFSFLADNKAFGTSLKTDTNINKPPASNGASKGNENGTNKKETSVIQSISSTTTSKTSDQADQGTNYEKYLKEIETKHGNESDKTTRTSEQSQFEPTKVTDNKETANSEKKVDSSPFGGTSTKSLISSEWKPEKSIFGSINTDSKSIFGTSDHATDSGKSVFGNSEQSSDSHKSIFGNVDKLGTKSVFGNVSSEKNPFLSKPSTDSKSQEQESKSELKSTSSSFGTTNAFCFGQSSTTSSTTGFSFGGAKPFTFGAQVVKLPESEDKAENEGKDDEDEEPPKVEIKPVTEEGAIYEQRCKVFIKKDGNFTSRGVGVLFLKPTPNDKTQLIVRAETSLGSLLLNTLLTESIPTKRMNKNSIMLVCLPKPEMSPPPVPVLLRVKTDEEADSLMDALNKHKK
ncbi:nuclear pore complex protein Nup50 isoform X2 [Nomia melanderi]|uniref:nuclear pore complex protein Nup50 isoform X2 n=1 Tax=Nomia melanderi TaxID=2448451 RepID=UPI0013042F29|nr:nuclear pore complex protein Nup50 isoform X2 [Nomia melanderi]